MLRDVGICFWKSSKHAKEMKTWEDVEQHQKNDERHQAAPKIPLDNIGNMAINIEKMLREGKKR
jgi:hypothetical protein